MLKLHRYNDRVLGKAPGARVCFVEVGPNQWFAIENASDPDKMPTGRYDLVMTRMASSKRPALLKEGTALFLHGLSNGDEVFESWHKPRTGSPKYVKGCPMPGMALTRGGYVEDTEGAMRGIFAALGGFEERKRVPFECIEYGALPEVQYEVTELVLPEDLEEWAYPFDDLAEGERWTRLPNGGVLVEKEVVP